jgi:pilus assembly protein FimV
MALGFGFNKAKVLATAEKYVQQGKLHNAISEYEKIVEKDAKDLTVLNTIGDLYSRLGQPDKAGECFKRVGDHYASEGFTVKAIALYKKLTKLNPGNIAVVQRLAELYTQQGLYNDARQQYLQLADHSVKNNDLDGATRVFQKMLEIDPDNVSLQTKLADLYLKMGKKQEARDIFMKAAQSLFDRGSAEQADQALDKMLALDRANVDALLMRGKIALDAGDGISAARHYEKVPDIDSRADSLQSLLRAYILSGNGEAAEGIARKLATVHDNLSGIRAYADFLLASGNGEAVLTLYDEWVERLIVGDAGELTFALQGLTSQAKENPASLLRLRRIFEKAGTTANIPEVNELLAHAFVQAGELGKARDLYKELAELEPSNPQHMQNYRQIQTRMGEEVTSRPLPAGEGSQALFVEEIDTPPPPTQEEYPASLMEKISNVLTDAELFESYNKPQQAIGPLESVLAKAPRDVRVNQRLISVYGRLSRLSDAAECCDTLKDVYHKADMAVEAHKYADMAVRFRERAGIPATAEPIALMPATPVAAEPTATVQELTAEAFDAPVAPSEAPAIPVELGESHEIDLSSEWEAAVAEPEEMPVIAPSPVEAADDVGAQADELHPSAVSDLLEEIRFYLGQGMLDEARSAIARCERSAAASFELIELKDQLKAAEGAPVKAAPAQQEPAVDEGSVVEFDFSAATAEVVGPAAIESTPTFEVAPPEPVIEEVDFTEVADEPQTAPAPVEMEVVPPVVEEVAEPEAVQAAPEWARAPEASYIEQFAVEESIEVAPESEPAVVEEPAKEAESVAFEEPVIAAPEPVAAASEIATAPDKDVLADFVLDLEGALPAEFGVPAPPTQAPPMAAAAVAAVSAPAPTPVPEIAAVASVPVAVAAAIPTAMAELSPAPVPQADSATDLSSLASEESSSVLSDLFAEFKEEVGEAQEEAEDPETHYNLGVAFKEMGLLDEAIGELQKVCKSIDRGTPFSQVMQAYTWLAGCFTDKGVPEASIKWYDKALTVATNDESRTALHYDLASAYEASGERRLALKHFMEVYGTNIDYRDVAERIKALKA